MNEKITAIEVVENFTPAGEGSSGWDRHDGYKVTTVRQEITVSISNGQSCCESWGYLASEDDLERFVGERLYRIQITDTDRIGRFVREPDYSKSSDQDIVLDAGDTMFVDFETSAGVFQLVAYNAHNGYYGHNAMVVSRELRHMVGL
jgi:hypothetical protein